MRNNAYNTIQYCNKVHYGKVGGASRPPPPASYAYEGSSSRKTPVYNPPRIVESSIFASFTLYEHSTMEGGGRAMEGRSGTMEVGGVMNGGDVVPVINKGSCSC